MIEALWKGWEFSQKKDPSRWITFLIMRLEQKLSEENN